MNPGLDLYSSHSYPHALSTLKTTPAFLPGDVGRTSIQINSGLFPEYFPSQLLKDSPVEVGTGMSCVISWCSVCFLIKDNRDKIKGCFRKAVFKGDMKGFHMMLQSCEVALAFRIEKSVFSVSVAYSEYLLPLWEIKPWPHLSWLSSTHLYLPFVFQRVTVSLCCS